MKTTNLLALHLHEEDSMEDIETETAKGTGHQAMIVVDEVRAVALEAAAEVEGENAHLTMEVHLVGN